MRYQLVLFVLALPIMEGHQLDGIGRDLGDGRQRDAGVFTCLDLSNWRPWGRRLGYEAVTGCSCQGYAWGGSWTPNFPLRKGYGAARAMIMLDWPTFADRRPGIDPDYAA